MTDWIRAANRDLLVYHNQRLGLKITRRPDSSVYWIMRGPDALSAHPTLEKAKLAAEAC